MRTLRFFVILTLLAALGACGTTKGVLDGTGSVLEGMAADVRAAGDFLSYGHSLPLAGEFFVLNPLGFKRIGP